MKTFNSDDQFGRRTLPGQADLLTANAVKAMTANLAIFRHRTPIGYHDPFTFYHLVYHLQSIQPNEPFSSKEFTDYLNEHSPAFIWEVRTVGRILMDLSESWEEIAVKSPLKKKLAYDGRWWWTTPDPEARASLVRLLKDLFNLCAAQRAVEISGIQLSRHSTPTTDCPSMIP